MIRSVRKFVAPAALLLGFGGVVTAIDAVRDPIPALDAQAAQSAAVGPQSLATAFRTASRTALAGVVYVQVEAAPRAVSQIPDQHRGTPFEQFFGGPGGPQRPQMGSGSGFIISQDGYVLTNNHVVANTSRVTVVLTDKREFDARVVGRDPNTDVAVLKIEGTNLPTVQLGRSDGLQVGDWVLALGYPLSLGETVTAGIVSAKGKSLGIMRQSREADAPLEHFIQTDAAINPGNSGGPLVDLEGRVVGINTAIASPTGAYAGYGFAVPIELARRVADDLIRHGSVRRPKLGVQIRDAAPADVEVFGLRDARGAVVASLPEGPAKEAGIQLGDVIVAVDGAPIKDTGDLMERVARRQPGEQVKLDLVRYGRQEQAAVRLGTFEAATVASSAPGRAESSATARLGLEAVEMSPALGQQFRSKHTSGVVITRVDPMGPAPQALTGMQVEKVNGHEIRSVRDLQALASGLKPGSAVSIIGRANEGEQTIINYRLRS
ncbi:Do family serine endopeptidase [soil metagenome]